VSGINYRRLRELGATFEGGTFRVALPLPTSPNGMSYRHCPNEDCAPRHFQLGDAREERSLEKGLEGYIRRQPGTAGVTCPYCGLDADDDEFIDERDVQALTGEVLSAVGEDVSAHIGRWAKDLNRQLRPRKNDLISLKVDVKTRTRPRPITFREDLLRDLTCAVCACRYGVYAIGIFCPDCGSPNLSVHFARELELVEKQVALAATAGDGEKPDEELAYRLLGNAHEDVVTALETYLKTAYRYVVRRDLPTEAEKLTAKRAIGNAFQNVEKGRKLLSRLDLDPFAGLEDAELETLRRNIEKRHVVGHNLGLADEHYVETAGDESVGHTVTLLAEQVSEFAGLCARVVGAVERDGIARAAKPSSN
jgi:hypothetical protein